jgi:phage-related holin
MFMQSLFIYVFFRYIVKDKPEYTGWSKKIKVFILVAVAALGVVLTRPIGFSVVIAVTGYFLFYREWKNLGLFLLSFAVLYFIYSLLKDCIWESSEQLTTRQASISIKIRTARRKASKI